MNLLSKKIMRYISVFLMSLIVISSTTTAYASTNENETNIFDTYNTDEYQTDEVITFAANAYNNLSPEAQELFLASLSGNPNLIEFHKTYVDPDFEEVTDGDRVVQGIDALTLLSRNLNALNLPSVVVYTLQAMGAGMVAAIADGPLPIGDILLAAATVTAAIVIAANWSAVEPVWNDIINAFCSAFKTSKSNIKEAFQSIHSESETLYNTSVTGTYNGRSVTVNNVRYYCSTRAEDLTESQKNISRYYVASLVGNFVFVDTAHPIPTGIAQQIVRLNHPQIGVWATSQSYARGICGGNIAKWHSEHLQQDGYFPHYHHPAYLACHVWYLG